MKFHFYKWKYVRDLRPDTFLGEPLYRFTLKFRICRVCGLAQRGYEAYDGVYCWQNLAEAKTSILKKKIVDKGKYYELLIKKEVKNNGK